MFYTFPFYDMKLRKQFYFYKNKYQLFSARIPIIVMLVFDEAESFFHVLSCLKVYLCAKCLVVQEGKIVVLPLEKYIRYAVLIKILYSKLYRYLLRRNNTMASKYLYSIQYNNVENNKVFVYVDIMQSLLSAVVSKILFYCLPSFASESGPKGFGGKIQLLPTKLPADDKHICFLHSILY